MPEVYLITGASTGFGALSARALAKEGHTVFAGIHAHDGNTTPHEAAIAQYVSAHDVDLRPVPLDLLSQASVDAAVSHVLSAAGHIDAVVHNAGHMSYGPAESFTPEQCLRLYDVNVVGCQRLNQAVLPHMRERRRGHLVWIGSSSTYGAKSPMLGPYFAAKAAQDSLAQSYAHELTAWGIETTIVSPGVFTKGTNHFQDAAGPGLPGVAKEYDEGPTRGMGQQTMSGTGDMPPDDADPQVVADALLELARAPRGKKPFRLFPDPSMDGGHAGAAVADNNKVNAFRRMGLMKYLHVWL